MQAALPMTVADRLIKWTIPLVKAQAKLHRLNSTLLQLQYGGPIGTDYNLEGKRTIVAESLAHQLGLINPVNSWHNDRSEIVEYASWLSMLTGAIGKIGQDICLMAQQGIDEISLTGGGSSSAMPHKQNPIQAELLVTLARFNAVQVSGMHQALIHEQERSGTAWALEWMILPQMCITTGLSLNKLSALLSSIKTIGKQ
jgi:3-carboxy-cis,cis-muconate cycloisomerase